MFDLDFSSPIDALVAHYNEVSKLLGEKIGIEGKHRLKTIEFAIDPSKLPERLRRLNPTAFRLERRINEEYEKNRFFSFANTSTENHLQILEQLEALATPPA